MNLALDLIRLDDNIQPRAQIDQATVDDYAEVMLSDQTLPAVTVFHDGTTHWLADGFHRVAAAKAADLTELAAEVRDGSKRDAILFAAGANGTHGLRRTNADKRRAVQTLLADDEWTQRSDNWIAKACRVTNHLVASVRGSLGDSPSARQTRDGRTMNTSRIGHGKAEPVAAQDAPAAAIEATPETVDPASPSTTATEPAASSQAALDLTPQIEAPVAAPIAAPPRPTPLEDRDAGCQVIYAAPTWPLEGTVEAYALKTLPVAGRYGDDAVLLLAVAAPDLQLAMSVIDAWGFAYYDCAGYDAPAGNSEIFDPWHELVLVGAGESMPSRAPIDVRQVLADPAPLPMSTRLRRIAALICPDVEAVDVLAALSVKQTDQQITDVTVETVDAQDNNDTTDDDDDAEEIATTAPPDPPDEPVIPSDDERLDAAVAAAHPDVRDQLRGWAAALKRRIDAGGPWRGMGNATGLDVPSQVQHLASESRRDPEATAHGLRAVMAPGAAPWSPTRPSSNVSAATEAWRREHPREALAAAVAERDTT